MQFQNILLLLGGLGLFLYGMKIMGEGLELAAGSKLKRLLEILTSNRFLAVIIGFVITAVIQSSSATTVMVVGFVNAGLMSLGQAVGVIMGANVGTTVTSILIAINLTDLAPIAIFLGVVISMFCKKSQHKLVGQILAGFGILFLGMSTMSGAMSPLKDSPEFQRFISEFSSSPWAGVLIGIIMTCILQSSSASVGILQALALQGLIPLNVAAFILYGQNIGTCVTALLSAIGTNKNSKRAAVIHLLFNVFGAGIFIAISLFTPYISWIDGLPYNTVVKISICHIVFNLVTTVAMLPLSNLLVKLSQKIIPGSDEEQNRLHLEFLDERILNTPPIAVAQVGKEVERMAALAIENLKNSIQALISGNLELVKELDEKEQLVNYLNHQITDYLVKINSLELQDSDTEYIGALFHVVNDIERIGDHATNLAETAEKVKGNSTSFTDLATRDIRHISGQVIELCERSVDVFRDKQLTRSYGEELYALEENIDDMKDKYQKRHIERLRSGICTAESGIQFTNALIDLERIGDHAINIAFSVAQPSK